MQYNSKIIIRNNCLFTLTFFGNFTSKHRDDRCYVIHIVIKQHFSSIIQQLYDMEKIKK